MTAPTRPTILSRPAAATLGGALVLLLALPAAAEPRALGEELGELRAELTSLDGHIQLAQMSGYDADRLNTFEGVVRDLTGRVETMEFRLRQLSGRLERLEVRLEEGAVAAATPEPAAPSATYRPPEEAQQQPGGPRVLGTMPQSPAPSPSPAPGEPPQAVAEPQPQPQPQPQQQAALPAGDAATQYDHAFGLLRQANWPEAEAALRAFLEQHPSHSLAGNAKYWLGETHYVRGDYVTAARVFAEGFQQYPNSGKASDNLLKLGMSLAALDRRQDACGTFVELERRYADAPAQIIQRSQAERNRLGC